MRFTKAVFGLGMAAALSLSSLVFSPSPATGEDFPAKPITVYCGFVAGATTDLTTRGLAAGAEKLLGVPVMVENKPGGSATVCTALVARKKPDGYTLAVVDSGAISTTPLQLNVAYNPKKDFTLIMQYSRYVAGLCVLSESPLKTIDEFIAYAKAHPGLTYGSSGLYTQQQTGIELFALCKGLKFKHVPYRGGAEAVTAFLGKHTDFICGTGSHIPYVRQGIARMLFVHTTQKRDPSFPDIPTLRELGCEDLEPASLVLIGPKGIPDPVVKKVRETFKKSSETPAFQNLLKEINQPYEYQDGAQVEKNLPADIEAYKRAVTKLGGKLKED